MKRNKQGFTLIELLVVIAIIGILATIALVSLNSARAKARDAKRLTELKSLASAIEVAAIDSSTPVAICGVGTSAIPVIATCATLGDLTTNGTWGNYKDPSGSVTACATGATAPCAYTIGKNSTTSTYQLCTYLEAKNNIGTGTAGLVSISNGGQFAQGCTGL